MVPKSSNKSSKKKIKNQGLLPFDGNNISNLEFNFNSVSKEDFDNIIQTNYLDIDLPVSRKRKWTIENLVKEIKKYKTLDDFRKEKKHLWIVYKQLVLIDKKNKIRIDEYKKMEMSISLQERINRIQSERYHTFSEILNTLDIIISEQKNKKLISDLKEIENKLRKITGISRY
jgi:hypothetical protein